MKAFVSLALAVTVLCAALPFVADLSDAASPQLSVTSVSRDTFVFEASESGTWLFDDGSSEVGASVTHTFSLSGLHRASFRGASGTDEVTALVVDVEPVIIGTDGSPYRYCPGIVRTVTTDCPGLSYDGSIKCLAGTPEAAGDYTVTIIRIDGTETSFGLTVGDAPLGFFTVQVDHQSVTASLYYQDIKKCSWTVYGSGGQVVRTGQGSTVTFTDLPLGTYKIVNLASVSLSSYGIEERIVTISEKDLADEDDSYAHQLNVLYYIAIAGLILFFAALILRVI